ncbi:Sporulation related domain protein [Brevundimonas sp. SH203]|uniref:SPOR domain-containing protein n=1 Tax=Brevundimonas sp. SH203 TaxID=345167 RepID=UPI0009C50F82|nr:SPOR domain-containing protein [Brevundimonas sp. SH203]GAW40027.1 Sporulation related domain protein [Brevundimonas sp. SH203]
MTPAEATRPVQIVPAVIAALVGSAALSACGAANTDPHRFTSLADQVASVEVPLTPGVGHSGPARSVEAAGLRPARFRAMRVAVMDPHAMWDARDDQAGVRRVADDAGLRDAVIRQVQPAVQAAAPIMIREVATTSPALDRAPLRHDASLRPAPTGGRTIQLGAYSSPQAARTAWTRLKASADLAALAPVFEPVEVQGRTLTRLKVGPVSREAAIAVCRAADVADAWCARNS